MFDHKAKLNLTIPGFKEEKVALKHFPTDDQWSERAAHTKQIIKYRRGEAQGEREDSGAFDSKLISELQEGTVEVSPKVATFLLDEIEAVDLVDIEVVGDTLEVELFSPAFGDLKHVLAIPTFEQLVTWKKKARVSGGRGKKAYFEARLAPSAKLYDSLSPKPEGYVDNVVPIVHKDAVLVALSDKAEEVGRERGNS